MREMTALIGIEPRGFRQAGGPVVPRGAFGVSEDASPITVEFAATLSGRTITGVTQPASDVTVAIAASTTGLVFTYAANYNGAALAFTYTLSDTTVVNATVAVASVPDAPVAAGGLADLSLTQDVAMTPVDVSTDFSDVDVGDTLTFSLAPSSGALPTGLSLSSAGVISGTPTELVTARSIVVRATDSFGLTADSGFSISVTVAGANVYDGGATAGATLTDIYDGGATAGATLTDIYDYGATA